MALTNIELVARYGSDVDKVHSWVHGPASGADSTVAVESDPALPTISKFTADLIAAMANGVAPMFLDLTPYINNTGAAATVRTLIQAAIDTRNSIFVGGDGVGYVDQTIWGDDDTRVTLAPSLKLKRLPGAGYNIFSNKAKYAPLVEVDVTYEGGLTILVGLAGHGLSVGNYLLQVGEAGTTPKEYIGTFLVKEVPSVDTVRLQLKSAPSGDPAGTIRAKRCNRNFVISGGVLDYNAAEQVGGVGIDLVAVYFEAAVDCRNEVDDIINVTKYCVGTAGTQRCHSDVYSSGTLSDGLKVYGPSTDDTGRTSGFFTDDAHSLQPREHADFVAYDRLGGGSITGYRVLNSDALTDPSNPGGTLHIYAHPWFGAPAVYMEQCMSPSSGGSCPIILDCTETSGTIGSVEIGRVIMGDNTSIDTGVITVLGPVTVERLKVGTLVLPDNPQAGGQSSFYIAGPGHVKLLQFGNITGKAPTGGNVLRVRGTVDNIEVGSTTCSPLTTGTGNFINVLPLGGIGSISISNGVLGAFENLVLIQATAAGDPRITLTNVKSSALCGVNSALGSRVTLHNTDLSSATNGAVLANGVVVNIFDDGTNSYPSGKLGLTAAGGTVNIKTYAGISGTTFTDFKFPGTGAMTTAGAQGFGTITPQSLTTAPWIAILKDQNATTSMCIRNNDSGSSALTMYIMNPNGNTGFLAMGSTAYNSNKIILGFNSGTPAPKFSLDTSGNIGLYGNIIPTVDNADTAGSASFRFKDIFSVNAVTVGSDQRLKTPLRALSDAEIAVGLELGRHIGVYQLLASIEEKDAERARLHIGLIAQQVDATCKAHGIDARRYGLFCEDPLFKVVVGSRKATRQAKRKVAVLEEVWETKDGKAVLTLQPVEHDEPVFDELPVFDADGNAVMIDQVPEMVSVLMVLKDEPNQNAGRGDDPQFAWRDVVVLDADQAPVMTGGAQRTRLVPVMEQYDEPFEETVPDLDEGGVQITRLGLRYEQVLLLIVGAFFQSSPPA